jgi:hypothetical protein
MIGVVDAAHASDQPERDEGGNTLWEMTHRTYDVSGRTARRGRDSLMRRLERLRSHWFLIAQTAVTAGLAWLVAVRLLGHPTPFFAPIAAIVTLGVTYGQRLRRGIEIAVGVAVGVLIGEFSPSLPAAGCGRSSWWWPLRCRWPPCCPLGS